MVALRRDEQRRNAVAVESRGLVLPLAHHGEQPRLEPLVPERCVGGHGAVDGFCFVFHDFMCVLVCGYSVTAARACDNIYAVMIVLLSGNSCTG